MKKRKIVFYTIIIIALSLNLLIPYLSGKNKVYEKKSEFKNSDEVIQNISNVTLKDPKNNDTDNFKECLSKRERTAGTDATYFNKIDVKKVDYTSETVDKILKSYRNIRQNFYKSSSDINEIAAVINVDTYMDNEFLENSTYDVVFIDEGEGYVIDYIELQYNDVYNFQE
ncbi:hypothetical protein [Clostridium sp. BJN0001]|uniref:hypothetical protein n=1 Tax=Clostridium sp. BJN0001 TaxID=2930219 RepID=UPI001FD4C6F0|nr:hypothetical protein [Clostridium sp. BJN0001]